MVKCLTCEKGLGVRAFVTVKLCHEIFGPSRPNGEIANDLPVSNLRRENASHRSRTCAVYVRRCRIRDCIPKQSTCSKRRALQNAALIGRPI
jgi:hypothetical protein